MSNTKPTKHIWKFPVQATEIFTIDMPRGAQVLSVQVQHDAPQMWAMVDPAAPQSRRTFRLIGTGNPFNDADRLRFIGTFQMRDGDEVQHLFEVVS